MHNHTWRQQLQPEHGALAHLRKTLVVTNQFEQAEWTVSLVTRKLM